MPVSKRPEDLLHEAAERGRVSFAIRRQRLRSGLRSVLQTAVSAALAWYLAKLVWGHQAPLFAPGECRLAAVAGVEPDEPARVSRD